MNETNEHHWIRDTFQAITVVVMLMVLVGCLIAPVFGPWIRNRLVREYAMDTDWEQKVKTEMRSIYFGLWLLSFLAWAFVLWCNFR